MATSNLDELKDRLYKLFDKAAERAESYTSSENTRNASFKATADIAKAIVAVETRLDERNTDKTGPRLPGK